MSTILIVCALALLALGAVVIKRARDQKQLLLHSITPEALHNLQTSNPEFLVFDVRQPLDLLADSEIIPGAKRIPPKELLANPSLIPNNADTVVYCTCASDATSRRIVKEARARHLLRVRFLRGGLSAWKAMGYSVVPYQESFHLDTRT